MANIAINNQTKFKIKQIALERFLRRLMRRVKQNFDLSVALVDRRQMKRLNRLYRHQNRPTDVLSFSNFVQEPKRRLAAKLRIRQLADEDLNEIIICYEVAQRQAEQSKWSTEQEIKFLLVHGFLHLLGFDHQNNSQKIKMDKMAAKLIKN